MKIFKSLVSIFNFFYKKLCVGDIVISSENRYGFHLCRIDRIYYRRYNVHMRKYCRLEFSLSGKLKMINVSYKSCSKI